MRNLRHNKYGTFAWDPVVSLGLGKEITPISTDHSRQKSPHPSWSREQVAEASLREASATCRPSASARAGALVCRDNRRFGVWGGVQAELRGGAGAQQLGAKAADAAAAGGVGGREDLPPEGLGLRFWGGGQHHSLLGVPLRSSHGLAPSAGVLPLPALIDSLVACPAGPLPQMARGTGWAWALSGGIFGFGV